MDDGPARAPGRESDGFVRAFARGLAVIEALGHAPGRHTMAEVAAAADIPRAAARRVLLTLVGLGYVRQDGRYFGLTPRSLGLGLSYLNSLPFWAPGLPVLEALRTEVGESCALAILDGAEIVYLLRLPARRIIAASLAVGSRLPAHAVSLGRVLLAGLPDDALATVLEDAAFRRLTPRTRTAADGLREALEQVRGEGFAWVDGEFDPAVCGMAVPLRGPDGRPVAAISVNAIAGSVDEAAARERFLVPLRRAAEEIRARAGLA